MPTVPSAVAEWRKRLPRWGIDTEIVAAAALLSAVLMIGLATAADYAFTVDEFNADDYGPKALAWYTSGFTDRSHFETVEFSLWYYGPWFHMLTAYVQSFDLADRITVRHAVTFLFGLAGVAALLPIGRLAIGRWAGLTAIALCLMTGYFYGSLFFTPIDVPFLAAITWATLAIVMMTREVLPSWPATAVVGLLTGLAIATRTGGIITHAYLLGAMLLCAAEFWNRHGRLTLPYIVRMGARYAAVVAIAWITAIALWPWRQIGNPWEQFRSRLYTSRPFRCRMISPVGRTDLDRRTAPLLHSGSAPGPVAGSISLPASGCVRLRNCRHRYCAAKRRRHGASTATLASGRRCWRWRAGGHVLSYARPLYSRSHFSSFSVRLSMTACGIYCSSFPCWRCLPAPDCARSCRCCVALPSSPRSSGAHMPAASSPPWPCCIRSNMWR